jgi:hypothetical protein
MGENRAKNVSDFVSIKNARFISIILSPNFIFLFFILKNRVKDSFDCFWLKTSFNIIMGAVFHFKGLATSVRTHFLN